MDNKIALIKKDDLLSKNELIKVVRNSLPVASTEFHIFESSITELDNPGAGYLGEHFKLKIVIKFDDQESLLTKYYFIKSLPLKDLHERKFIMEWGVFKKEVDIYKHLFQQMGDTFLGVKWRPKSYLYRDDLMVMEDMTYEGFVALPGKFDFKKVHIQTVLKSLAALHAKSLDLEKNVHKSPLSEKYSDLFFEFYVHSKNEWFCTGLRAIEAIALKKSKYSKDREIYNLIKIDFLKKLYQVCELDNNIPVKYGRVLCHRDIWLNNFMFKFTNDMNYDSPEQCVLFDFQTVRYHPPAVDIMVCFCMLQHSSVWKKDFDENLQYYYECLTTFLRELCLNVEDILSYDILKESCNFFILLGLVIKAVSHQITHLPKGVMQELQKDKERYKDFITGDERINVMFQYIEVDEYFGSGMIRAVDELIEHTILQSFKID